MNIIQKCKHAVIFVLLQWIELVVVALRTADGKAQHALSNGVHTIEHRLHAELFRIHAAFLVDHGIAQKAGGHNLILRSLRQQITSQLLNQELVVWQVAIQCVDDIVTVKPYAALLVFFKAIGIGIASGVQPVAAPTLSVVG